MFFHFFLTFDNFAINFSEKMIMNGCLSTIRSKAYFVKKTDFETRTNSLFVGLCYYCICGPFLIFTCSSNSSQRVLRVFSESAQPTTRARVCPVFCKKKRDVRQSWGRSRKKGGEESPGKYFFEKLDKKSGNLVFFSYLCARYLSIQHKCCRNFCYGFCLNL